MLRQQLFTCAFVSAFTVNGISVCVSCGHAYPFRAYQLPFNFCTALSALAVLFISIFYVPRLLFTCHSNAFTIYVYVCVCVQTRVLSRACVCMCECEIQFTMGKYSRRAARPTDRLVRRLQCNCVTCAAFARSNIATQQIFSLRSLLTQQYLSIFARLTINMYVCMYVRLVELTQLM